MVLRTGSDREGAGRKYDKSKQNSAIQGQKYSRADIQRDFVPVHRKLLITVEETPKAYLDELNEQVDNDG